MSNKVFIFLSALIAGYLLLGLPLGGTFLAALGPAIKIIAILTVLIFAAVLIYRGLQALLNRG